jgi:hypothetical protein
MAGQAGWYKAPGEDGLLRYWNGTEWTKHRQPVPEAIAPPEAARPVEDPDPMAEYERQFDTPSLPDEAFDHPTFDFDARPLDSSSADSSSAAPSTDVVASPPQPQYRPQAALAAAPVVPTPTPEFAGKSTTIPRSLGPIALGPIAPAATPVVDAPETEFERMYREMSELAEASTPAPTVHATPTTDAAPTTEAAPATEAVPIAGLAPVEAPAYAPSPVATGIAPNRKAVLGAVRIMAGAIIIILLGVAAMVFFSLANTVSAGDVKTNAIVTSLGATTSTSCTPIARFAVAGRSYTASSSTAISPCPIGLGESVDVIYSAANPALVARIEVGSSATQYLWLIPILGGLVFVVGLVTFIIRAGSILGGIALFRAGRRSSAEHDGEQETEHGAADEFADASPEHVS